jgi:hypothetical protein
VGRNALIAAIVLLLGVATASAVVRAGDDDGRDRLAQTAPGTTMRATPSTTATTSTTAATAAAPTSLPATAGSGLASSGAGQVSMGPTTPNTGIESGLAPGVVLAGAGVALRVVVLGRRRGTP